jgi:hypothetical protein
LQKRGSLNADFVNALQQLLVDLDAAWFVGVPMRRTSARGSYYYDGHFFALNMQNGEPKELIGFHPDKVIRTGEFTRSDPTGSPLRGNAIAAARIAIGVEHPFWQTELWQP